MHQWFHWARDIIRVSSGWRGEEGHSGNKWQPVRARCNTSFVSLILLLLISGFWSASPWWTDCARDGKCWPSFSPVQLVGLFFFKVKDTIQFPLYYKRVSALRWGMCIKHGLSFCGVTHGFLTSSCEAKRGRVRSSPSWLIEMWTERWIFDEAE